VRQAEGDMWSSLAGMAGKLYESAGKPESLKSSVGGATRGTAEGTTRGRFKNLFTSEDIAQYSKYLQPKKSGI